MSILTVGPNQKFSTISDAVAVSHDGDVIQVSAGTYVNDFATINTKITIEGVGGMVHLLATQSPSDGKAILTTNTDVTLDHLEFSGAQVADGNGAGVRYQGGNLTITNSYFHDNQDGILATPGTAGTGNISISTSEFAHNGDSDGYTHNIYIGDIASLAIDQSYFHDAVVGHEIKSRAEQTSVTNSRIQDGPAGTASYSIDLPNGGKTLIQNNTIEQGPQSQNPAIIAYGEEGDVHASSGLTVTGNTILNDLPGTSPTAVWNASSASASMTNNAVFGLPTGQFTKGAVSASGNTTLSSEPALATNSPITSGGTGNAGAAAASSPVTTTPTAPAAVTTASAATTASVTTPGSDTLVLHLSEDAYQGDAQFIATLDGQPLGSAHSVTALHGLGQTADFTFTGSFGAGPHDLAVSFLNDAYGGSAATDRNLYVNAADFDGTSYPSASAALYGTSTVHFALPAPVTA